MYFIYKLILNEEMILRLMLLEYKLISTKIGQNIGTIVKTSFSTKEF